MEIKIKVGNGTVLALVAVFSPGGCDFIGPSEPRQFSLVPHWMMQTTLKDV